MSRALIVRVTFFFLSLCRPYTHTHHVGGVTVAFHNENTIRRRRAYMMYAPEMKNCIIHVRYAVRTYRYTLLLYILCTILYYYIASYSPFISRYDLCATDGHLSRAVHYYIIHIIIMYRGIMVILCKYQNVVSALCSHCIIIL